MARSAFHSSLALLVALVSGCGGAGNGASEPEPGDPAATEATSSDSDSDRVVLDQDLCPQTLAGVPVDGNGCSAEQRTAPTTDSQSGAAGGASGDGAVAENGFAVFVLDPQGTRPITLRTLASNVTHRDNGFALAGTVLIDVPDHSHVTLAEAKLQLGYDAAQGEGLQSVRGSTRLPFPDLGFMHGVSVSKRVYAAVDYDWGNRPSDVQAPLEARKKYLYFTYSTGFQAQLGSMTVTAENDHSVSMALDPADPSFFLRAALDGFMGSTPNATLGFSIGGHLPFRPENTWGIGTTAASFDGQLWIDGPLNLNDWKLPIAISGNTVLDLNPNDAGESFLTNPALGFQFGANSALEVSFSAGTLAFEIPIATGTIVGRRTGKDGSADYSGTMTAGNAWIPATVALKSTRPAKIAGHASGRASDSSWVAEGNWSLDAGKLGQWTGLDLTDLPLAHARLNADPNGLTVVGVTGSSLSPYLTSLGDLTTAAFFNGRAQDWYVTLDGHLAVSGVDLSSGAYARLDPSGLQISGTFRTPLSAIDMSGKIKKSEVDLEGTAPVTIPIIGGKETSEWLTDATACGYETVTDGAVCGFDTLANGALCGFDTVQDATLCGTTIVRDPALCGTSNAPNAAECGVHLVTDGLACGYETVTSCSSCIPILWGPPCDCGLKAKSCYVASTCTFPNSCPVAARCELPKTCAVPKTCSRVKTCETKVTVPDFNYGSFEGVVSLKIGNDGLVGSVAGQYCATGGSCTKLTNGRLELSSGKPEACVTIAAVGEVCAPF